eukprot:TRINITY_DN10868_c0_g1_i1.p1 TRINITY_DN10868_c0_g1~~TRINITY_DN10868_c0_g1_i1.p1  ORF type:complete len:265 (+),score=-62.49 TRINITY_DN10868_c0_g1_i1:226-1020(+)
MCLANARFKLVTSLLHRVCRASATPCTHARPLLLHACPLLLHAYPLPLHACPLPLHACPLPLHACALSLHARDELGAPELPADDPLQVLHVGHLRVEPLRARVHLRQHVRHRREQAPRRRAVGALQPRQQLEVRAVAVVVRHGRHGARHAERHAAVDARAADAHRAQRGVVEGVGGHLESNVDTCRALVYPDSQVAVRLVRHAGRRSRQHLLSLEVRLQYADEPPRVLVGGPATVSPRGSTRQRGREQNHHQADGCHSHSSKNP